MSRKLLFFDIDGTLLDERTQLIPESTRAAIEETRKRGNLAFINTGRTASCVDDHVRAVGFDGMVCGCGTWIEMGGEVLLREELSHEESVKIVLALREMRLPAAFEGNRNIYYDDENSGLTCPELEGGKRYFGQHGIGGTVDLSDPEFCFTKFFIYIQPDSDMEAFRELIKGRFDWIVRGEFTGEIALSGYSKGTGIDYLCEKLGVTLEDCYAFGDGPNDLPMLTHVPNSVAIGSGDPAIFASCAYVSDPLLEDGLAKAMRKYGLIG